MVTPGPGTYGKGGIPQAALEERTRQSFGTVAMFDSGAKRFQALSSGVRCVYNDPSKQLIILSRSRLSQSSHK